MTMSQSHAAPSVALNARERLLSTAAQLFSQRGINATGVDLVLAQSGVAKGSLYHHFSGKQGLILAYLKRERENWQAATAARDDASNSASVRLDQMFQSVIDAVLAGTFHGCPFTNAIIERPDDSEVRAEVDQYCARLREHIASVIDTTTADPVVDQIFMIYNGALTSVKLSRDVEYLRQARSLSRVLIAQG